MKFPTPLIIFFAVAVALALGADTNTPDPSTAATATSKELGYSTYVETVGRVTVIVGSFSARLYEKESYVPLQIAVGVAQKGPELAIGIDDFSLADDTDHVYLTAPTETIGKQPGMVRMMDSYDESSPLQTGNLFETYRPVRSRLYTTQGVGDAFVHLDRETYFTDNIYFANPGVTALEGVLTLRFETKGMDDPVEVRFKVPLKGEKKKKKKRRA